MTVGPGDGTAERAGEAIRAAGGPEPRVAIVMGSGLGSAASRVEPDVEVPYGEIPGFPLPTVPGHEGKLVLGHLSGVPVAAFLGRFHYYEGHPMSVVTLPTRVAAELGVEAFISTGAVGGLEPEQTAGSLVVATDHVNLLGENPLRGWRDDHGTPPFVDLARAYDLELADLAISCASELGILVHRGVYAAMPGPTYETPAEIAFLRQAGASVVGMSLVPEAVAAAALGIRFTALLCVTNVVGAGLVNHQEVTGAAAAFAERLGELLAMMLPKI